MTQHDSHPFDEAPNLSAASVGRVHNALGHLRGQLQGPTVAAEDLVKPILDLWAAAYQVHPWVARPVEHFLSALSSRRAVPAPEVSTVAEDVSLLLLEVRSLTAGPQRAGTAEDRETSDATPVPPSSPPTSAKPA